VTPSSDSPRILLIRPSALGDVLRTVPVVASLKRAFPRSTIDWVVQEGFEDAVRGNQTINEIIPFPRNALGGWRYWTHEKRRTVSHLKRKLWRQYDLAIDMQGLGRSGFMLFTTRAERRIGFANASEFAWLGANERYEVPRDLHAVTQMLTLLESSGIKPIEDMSLVVPKDSEADWLRVKSIMGVPDSFVVFAPTSRWKSKEWPAEYWQALAGKVLTMGANHIVLLGAPSESARLHAIAQRMPLAISVLAGEATVGVSMAAVRDAQLLVANDSAMLHAAVGFNTPLVGLFGPTDPNISGPFKRLDETIRSEEAKASSAHYRDRSLGDELMRTIPVEMVTERLHGRL